MIPIRLIRCLAAALAGLAAALVIFGAAPAFARRRPSARPPRQYNRSRSAPSSSAACPAGRSP